MAGCGGEASFDVASVPSPRGVRAVSLRGFVTLAQLADLSTRLDVALGEDGSVHSIVLDVLQIAGFEPGVPARVIQWVAQRADRVGMCVVVTTSPVLVATAQAGQVLVPDVRITAAASLAQAFARIRAEAPARRERSITGVVCRSERIAEQRVVGGRG